MRGVAVLASPNLGPPLVLSSDDAELGADVYLLSYGGSATSMLREHAQVAAVMQDGKLWLDGVGSRPGVGGAPIIGRSGSVVGMAYEMWQGDGGTVNVVTAIPVGELRASWLHGYVPD